MPATQESPRNQSDFFRPRGCPSSCMYHTLLDYNPMPDMEFYPIQPLSIQNMYIYIYLYTYIYINDSTAWPCIDSFCSNEPTTYFKKIRQVRYTWVDQPCPPSATYRALLQSRGLRLGQGTLESTGESTTQPKQKWTEQHSQNIYG